MAGEAIFIGYRRDDTADVAGRVYDAFARRFGRAKIFKDVDSLRPGADFGAYIKNVLPRCRVALILIGPHWLDARDERGGRRLDDPNDWVRIEIETALETSGLDVVPVLINGARLPRAEDLPESLRPLLRRHAAAIRRDPDFHGDVGKLIEALRASVKSGVLDFSGLGGERKAAAARPDEGGRRRLGGMFAAGVFAALAVLALGYGALRFWPALPADEQEIVEEEGEGLSAAADEAAEHSDAPPSASPAPDVAAWDAARASNSPAALRAFIGAYPSSAFASSARERLAGLDRAAWQIASADPSADGVWAGDENSDENRLRNYLRHFPEGEHAAQARQWLIAPSARVHVSGPQRVCPGVAGYTVYFEWGSASLVSEAVAAIDHAVRQMPQSAYVEVVGHTDTSILASLAMALSERRASTVRDALVQRGVRADVISAWGAGEMDLARQTANDIRDPLNRRATIKVCAVE